MLLLYLVLPNITLLFCYVGCGGWLTTDNRSMFYAVCGVSLVTLAIAGYVAVTASNQNKDEPLSISKLLTSCRTSLSSTLSSVSSSLGWQIDSITTGSI